MATPIQVVLQDDVDNLGKSGSVVKVRPGFARNFLYPRGQALPATAANLSKVDELKKAAAVKAEATKVEAKKVADQLSALSVKIVRAVGAENKMYGSVTSKDIEDAYAEKGVKLDRRNIELKDPIRTLGLSEVSIRLHPEVSATLRVEVIKG
ncbi:MAG: 50S ribosomal protein L9 [Polyangiaceae bacterium]